MRTRVGVIASVHRYPVKSMAGEWVGGAMLGWHGVEGDRRFALRRVSESGGFPWLSASRCADLLRYTPLAAPDGASPPLPSHVRTPEGEALPILGGALAADVARRLGAPVEMMRLDHGVFDEADVSVIATSTIEEVSRLAGMPADPRRFRPNVLVRLEAPVAFGEDAWVGGVITFGEGETAPAMAVTLRDLRCSMIGLDPDTAEASPELLKAVARVNQTHAGVYGAVVRTGAISVGMPVWWIRAAVRD